jgi:hypothetical protein
MKRIPTLSEEFSFPGIGERPHLKFSRAAHIPYMLATDHENHGEVILVSLHLATGQNLASLVQEEQLLHVKVGAEIRVVTLSKPFQTELRHRVLRQRVAVLFLPLIVNDERAACERLELYPIFVHRRVAASDRLEWRGLSWHQRVKSINASSDLMKFPSLSSQVPTATTLCSGSSVRQRSDFKFGVWEAKLEAPRTALIRTHMPRFLAEQADDLHLGKVETFETLLAPFRLGVCRRS